jgi:hypothetical protein
VEPVQSGSFEEITEHLVALFDSLDLCDTDEARAACQEDIARYLEAQIRKVDGIAAYLTHCKQQEAYAAEEIKRLQARKKSWENRHESLKQYVACVMEFHKFKKLEGRTSTLTLQPCPVSVEFTDEAQVPLLYKTVALSISGETWAWLQQLLPGVEPKLSTSKTAVKEALEQKVEVPGATLRTDKKTVVVR